MPELTVEIGASAVAWYGAIVATVAVIISAWLALRDRPRIVVTGRAPYRVMPGGPYDPTKDYILITVANHGRRPRTIEKVGFKLRPGGTARHILAADSAFKGPQELTEGRSSTWVVQQEGISLDVIEYLWALDQTGKEFRGQLEKNPD